MRKFQVLTFFLLLLIPLTLSGCHERTGATSLLPPSVSSSQSSSAESESSVSPPQSSSTEPAPSVPSESSPVSEPTPMPGASSIPDSSSAPEAPSTPEVPLIPEVPSSPEVPSTTEPAPSPNTPSESIDPPSAPPPQETDSWVYHEKVPILMYHEVNDALSNSLFLSVKDFTNHLDYFEHAGITPISMQQLYDHWFNNAPLPDKPIVLTFDDGYLSMYTTVYPLLKERGWSGTFYCITNTRGANGHLTDAMITEMAANGMEIGSHTVSHSDLSTRTGDKLLRELSNSKEILSSSTGKEVNMLCYPSGRYNEETITVAQDVGYLGAVTTKNGFATKSQGMFELKRVRISQGYGASWLKKTLAPLGY